MRESAKEIFERIKNKILSSEPTKKSGGKYSPLKKFIRENYDGIIDLRENGYELSIILESMKEEKIVSEEYTQKRLSIELSKEKKRRNENISYDTLKSKKQEAEKTDDSVAENAISGIIQKDTKTALLEINGANNQENKKLSAVEKWKERNRKQEEKKKQLSVKEGEDTAITKVDPITGKFTVNYNNIYGIDEGRENKDGE
jgi:hypothetical protein